MCEIKNIHKIRKLIKSKIYNKDNLFHGNECEKTIVKDLFKRTVINGESNSGLLIGCQGSGKTTLVNNILNDLKISKGFYENSVVIWINGLIHTDDKLALKSIATQMLHQNIESEDDNEELDNYYISGNFADYLNFLLSTLKCGKQYKSILFILEEFDLFCTHHNQTLLYNLLDVAQSAQAPLCVLGLTSNINVTDLLEKRVKSRFSHRKIWLHPDLSERIKNLLTIESPTKQFGLNKLDISSWNSYINDILKSTNVENTLKIFFSVSKNQNILNNLLIKFIGQLDINKKLPDKYHFIEIFESYLNTDSKAFMLNGLSILEICLLISMKHHCEIYDNEPFNFEMIYNRYKKFINSDTNGGMMQLEAKQLVMKAFEHLTNLELLTPISNKNKYSPHQMYVLNLDLDQILSIDKTYNGLPTSISQWLTSSII